MNIFRKWKGVVRVVRIKQGNRLAGYAVETTFKGSWKHVCSETCRPIARAKAQAVYDTYEFRKVVEE